MSNDCMLGTGKTKIKTTLAASQASNVLQEVHHHRLAAEAAFQSNSLQCQCETRQ